MKHFIVIINYTASSEIIDRTRPAHRAYLQTGLNSGLLLMSGPRNPVTGGMAVARAESMDDLISFFKGDPYQINNLATYEFIEFDPVFYQSAIKQWVSPKESIRTIE